MKVKFKKLSVVAALLFAVVLCVPITYYANANSAVYVTVGMNKSDALVLNDNCPVVVEEENLTFNINEFPQTSFINDEQAFKNYNANVTAEYNLYNPADYDVKVSLAFPIGNYPSYGFRKYDSDGKVTYTDTSDKYDITLDGQKIEKTVSYTYGGAYYSSDLESQLKRLKGEGHEHVNTQANVTTFKYKVSGINNAVLASQQIQGTDRDVVNYASATISIPKDTIICLNGWISDDSADGDNYVVKVMTSVYDGSTFELTVIGDIEETPSFNLYSDIMEYTQLKGECVLVSQTQKTFTELALENKSVTNITDENWVTIFADMLEDQYHEKYVFFASYYNTDSITCWYLYEISIPSGGRAVNTVNAPLYPTISGGNLYYIYDYQLSPAGTWADFKKLNIKVNTPYYIRSSTPSFSAKVDGSYSFSVNELPEYDVYIRMSETKNDSVSQVTYFANAIAAIIISWVIMIPVKFIVGGIGLLIFVAKKK